MTFAVVLFLLAQSVLSQDQWRIVYQDGTVEAVWGTPELSGEQRSRVRSAWVWSQSRAPRKVEAQEIGRRAFPDDPGRLRVRIARPAGSRPAPGLRVIAAPVAMWGDIPESSLPSWPVPAKGRLAVPLDPSQRWRLRVAGEGEGTWWVDVPPGKTSVLLTPVAAGGIDLTVTGGDGEPVVPVSCTLLEGVPRKGSSRFWAWLRSDSGRLTAPGLPDAEEIALTVMNSGYAPAAVRGRPGDLPRHLRLAAGAGLAGRVTDAAGRPIAGARIAAEAWTSPQVPQLYRRGADSRADGSWELAGFAPGPVAVSIRVPGFAPWSDRIEVSAGRQDLGTIVLEPGLSLAVLAVDDLGEPVAGAKVETGSAAAVASDARGLARLTGLPAAPLEVRASASRHLPGRVRLNPPWPATSRIELPRAFTVQGRFVDAAGAPVGGGSVEVDKGGVCDDHPLDDDGRFEIDLPPATALELVLRSPATRELRLPLAAGAPGELRDLGDLAAPPGVVVTGRVVRADTGAPVAGARLWLPRPGPLGPVAAWAGRDLLEATTGEDGRFHLAGLPPGPALVRVEAAGFARAHLDLVLQTEGSPLDAGEVYLSAGTTLRVFLEDRDDDTEGAVARADLRNGWLEPDMLTAPVRDGEATLRHVPAGTLTLSVLTGRKLLCERQVEVPEGEAEIAVDCQRSAILVSGTVRSGGKAAGPGMLLWRPPALGAAARIDNVYSPGGLRQQQAFGTGRPQVDVAVAADGTFASTDLSPGSWEVSWLPAAGATSGSQTVEIPRGERHETVLEFPGLGITGVVMEEERPVAGARVRDFVSGALTFSAADGSFSLAGLAAGRATLQAQHEGLSSPIVEVELREDRPAEPVHLSLSERPAPRLEVRVTDAEGGPVAGAFVFLEEDGRGQRILTTAADGRAIASLEPPLAARVRAAATSGNAWGWGGWVDWEKAREGLVVPLDASGSLILSSETRQGSPRVVSAEGWDLSWLLRQLGAPVVVAPGQPLRLNGLPAGRYLVSLGDASRMVAVQQSAPAEARFE